MLSLKHNHHLVTAEFQAMASPCQILIDTDDLGLAENVAQAVYNEVKRIEAKFSRYRADSIVSAINRSQGTAVAIDEETCRLLNFADTLFQLSDGMFDITSGVLRRVWQFDGSGSVPSQEEIDALLPAIGWHHVQWHQDHVVLPQGMEIDLGGIGKEYAVDAVFDWIAQMCDCACVVNFGGDLRTRGARADGSLWQIGIEHPEREGMSVKTFALNTAAMATSGDAHRHVLKNGVRYGHLLNPHTGCPVQGVARSVTVQADTCTTAGMLSSLALLQGEHAQAFLEAQTGIQYWLTV